MLQSNKCIHKDTYVQIYACIPSGHCLTNLNQGILSNHLLEIERTLGLPSGCIICSSVRSFYLFYITQALKQSGKKGVFTINRCEYDELRHELGYELGI